MWQETKTTIDGIPVIIRHEETDNADKMAELREVAQQGIQIAKELNRIGGTWEVSVQNHWFYLKRDGGIDCKNSSSGLTISGHLEEKDKFYFSVDTGTGKYIYQKPEEFGERVMRSAAKKSPATIAQEIARRILPTAEKYAEYCRLQTASADADDLHQSRLVEKYREVFRVQPPKYQYERDAAEKKFKEAQKVSRSWGFSYKNARLEIPAFRSSKLKLEFTDITEEEADTLMMWYHIMQDEKAVPA